MPIFSLTGNLAPRTNYVVMTNNEEGWQTFSLEHSTGTYRYSQELKAFEVIYTPQIGFLQMSPDELEQERFLITMVMDKWETCKELGDTGREIIKTYTTDEIKEHIILAQRDSK